MSYMTDPVFQTIQLIRTPEVVEEVLCQVWRQSGGRALRALQLTPGLTNYKPFERARVMAQATIRLEGEEASAVTLNLFFHVFAEAQKAYWEVKNRYDSCIPPVLLISHWQTVVWLLPNAPNLQELAALLNPEKFCKLLVPLKLQPKKRDYPTPQLLRYVPLKRALLTWEHPSNGCRYFAKLINETDAFSVIRNFQQIDAVSQAGELSFAVPEIVSYNPAMRTLLMSEVKGIPFTQIMRLAHPQPFAQLGEVLAGLHRLKIQPLTLWTPDKELNVLHRHMKGVKLALPQLKKRLTSAIAQLEKEARQLSFPTDYLIHGNLFGDQILYHREQIGLVDWDALSLGDPLYDIGRLIAHFIYIAGQEELSPVAVSTCIKSLLKAYEAKSGEVIDNNRLLWHIATQLLLRGKISSLRKLSQGWQAHLAFVVTECERLLNNQSLYFPLLLEVC